MELTSVSHTTTGSLSPPAVVDLRAGGSSAYAPEKEGRSQSKSTGSRSLTDIHDPVSLSADGKEKSAAISNNKAKQQSATTTASDTQEFDNRELQVIRQLQKRDTEVRSHEQAHLSAAGQYARGGTSFTFKKGPDGNAYAVGGSVGIDVSKEASPEATITKMQTVQRAALAPANPSHADRRIANQASVNEARARQEIQQEVQEELLAGVIENPDDLPVSNNSSEQPTIAAPYYSSLTGKLDIYRKMSDE